MIGSQSSSIPQYLKHSHGTSLNVMLFEIYLFLPRPIREVLNLGILSVRLSVCLSVRLSVRGVAAKRCVVKG